MQEVPYTEESFLVELEQCSDLLETAERYEVMGALYRIIIPLLEKRREYVALSDSYLKLHTAYANVVRVNNSGRRLLGTYFRVKFFNQVSLYKKCCIGSEPQAHIYTDISSKK